MQQRAHWLKVAQNNSATLPVYTMIQKTSLVPRQRESLDDLIMCVMTYTMRGFMHGFGNRIIAHKLRLSALSELPCWLSQRLMPLKTTGRRPREATTNNCESWKRLLQHEHGYSTWWFQVANFCRANHAVYLRVVHRSCVVSVDQVDTCRETKYRACVPWRPCEILTTDVGLAMPG